MAAKQLKFESSSQSLAIERLKREEKDYKKTPAFPNNQVVHITLANLEGSHDEIDLNNQNRDGGQSSESSSSLESDSSPESSER